MTTTRFDDLTKKAQRIERELREARAREARVRALAKQFDEAGSGWHGTLIRVALDRPDVTGWVAALGQDGDDVA